MKLVIAVVHAKDATGCTDALTTAGFVCTRLASQGGFLDRDNVTLLIGVDEPLVDKVLDVIRQRARTRHETLETSIPMGAASGVIIPVPVDVEVGGATVFVVDVDRFEKL